MKHITATTAQKDLIAILNDVTRNNEPVTIVSDDSNTAVILSMEEWNNIQETLYLQAIPGMVKSIKVAANEPLEKGIDAKELDYNV